MLLGLLLPVGFSFYTCIMQLSAPFA